MPEPQVVPTMYSDLKNRTINTNQYSVTEHFKESNIPMQHNLPGVFFYYDLSPIKVDIQKQTMIPFRECCKVDPELSSLYCGKLFSQ